MHDHEHLAETEHKRSHRPRTAEPDMSARAESPGLSNSAMAAFLGGVNRSARRSQGAGPLDEDTASDINHERGGGTALDDSTRDDMEANLGVDLSGVRVHTGSRADNLSRSVQADAFTTGSDVFFASGKYQPSTSDGRRLLAHELTHVVQQSTGTGGEAGRVSHPDDAHEQEASAVGDAVAANAPSPAAGTAPQAAAPAVARQAAPAEDEEQEEEVARQAAPAEDEEQEEEVARQAAPAEDEEQEDAAVG